MCGSKICSKTGTFLFQRRGQIEVAQVCLNKVNNDAELLKRVITKHNETI